MPWVVQLKRLGGSSSAVGGRSWSEVFDELFLDSCRPGGAEVTLASSQLPSTISLGPCSYDETVASE